MNIRKLLLTIALCLCAACAYAQNQIFPVAGVVTINCSGGTNSVKVIVNAAVTSVVFSNPGGGQIVTVLFQHATERETRLAGRTT